MSLPDLVELRKLYQIKEKEYVDENLKSCFIAFFSAKIKRAIANGEIKVNYYGYHTKYEETVLENLVNEINERDDYSASFTKHWCWNFDKSMRGIEINIYFGKDEKEEENRPLDKIYISNSYGN